MQLVAWGITRATVKVKKSQPRYCIIVFKEKSLLVYIMLFFVYIKSNILEQKKNPKKLKIKTDQIILKKNQEITFVKQNYIFSFLRGNHALKYG